MNFLFILNPRAGRKKKAKELVDLIDQLMTISGHTYEFAYTIDAGDATQISKQAIKEKFDIIVAVGGDGTVNEVASGLVHTDGILGIIPVGSGNGVARSLNIPLNTAESIKYLFSPKISCIDIGKVNDKFFVGVCGIGYDALIGKRFQQFGIRGPIPYFLIGVKEFLEYHPQNYTLEFETEILNKKALTIAFANTRQYGNDAIIAPDADPSDGFLDVCLIESLSYPEVLKILPMLFKGNIGENPKYIHKRCKSVKVRSDKENLIIHRDGEPDEIANIFDIRIEEKALRVCSPIG
jgi:YegS/Rv2252/BmrU family lipid kinase